MKGGSATKMYNYHKREFSRLKRNFVEADMNELLQPVVYADNWSNSVVVDEDSSKIQRTAAVQVYSTRRAGWLVRAVLKWRRTTVNKVSLSAVLGRNSPWANHGKFDTTKEPRLATWRRHGDDVTMSTAVTETGNSMQTHEGTTHTHTASEHRPTDRPKKTTHWLPARTIRFCHEANASDNRR